MKRTSLFLAFYLLANLAFAQQNDPLSKLNSFDADIDKMLKDWNVPGCGFGEVIWLKVKAPSQYFLYF